MAWLVIGISGVTCGGKSTLAAAMSDYLSSEENKNSGVLCDGYRIGKVAVVNQDAYFLPVDSSQHQWIARLNHINWETTNAVDMPRMCDDIQAIIGEDRTKLKLPIEEDGTVDSLSNTNLDNNEDAHDNRSQVINILIIEGFLILNHPFTFNICDVKFHLHLPYEKCFARRKLRSYVPADVVGYFELCVWPMYEKHFAEFRDLPDVHMLNGEIKPDRLFLYALKCIRTFLEKPTE